MSANMVEADAHAYEDHVLQDDFHVQVTAVSCIASRMLHGGPRPKAEVRAEWQLWAGIEHMRIHALTAVTAYDNTMAVRS